MATKYFLPRGVPEPGYGDRLRAAGLNAGATFSPNDAEIDLPESLTPDQVRTALSLATAPASSSPLNFSNADIARFWAQQNGGALPGLPTGGGDDGSGGGRSTTPTTPTLTESTTPTGDISSFTGAGRSSIQAAIDQAVSALNSPTGQNTINTVSALGAIPGIGSAASLAATAARLTGSIGRSLGFGTEQNPDPTVEGLNTALGGGFRGSTPEAQQAFAQQRAGERAPEEDVHAPGIPQGPPPAPPATPPEPPEEPEGNPNAPTATTGGAPGPGTAGPGAGTAGPTGSDVGESGGSASEGARGGLVGAGIGAGRPRQIPGSFKGAKKFSGGGSVPMTRAQRVADFEKNFGARQI